MSPEVGAAVGDGAVAEQVAVADGVQVGNGADVVSAGAAAPPPLAVGAMRVPDAPNMQRVGQIPLGSSGQDSFCRALCHHQEQRRHRQQEELHDESGRKSTQEIGYKDVLVKVIL